MSRDLDPDVPFLDLDLAEVGDALVRLVLTARQLGRRASFTVDDYYPAGTSQACDFVRDAFLLHPNEIADRWFGGRDNAVKFTGAILSDQEAQR